MRPVVKKQPGETIPVTDNLGLTSEHVIQTDYTPYGTAKGPLIANIGSYCSYCEEYHGFPDLHIEHTEAKSQGGSLTSWGNFLITCNICNSIKGKKPVTHRNTHFPHLDDTFHDFIYEASGRIKVNPNLPEEEKAKAQSLYDAVGLGRDPFSQDTISDADYRWAHRYETWKIATDMLQDYENGLKSAEDIISYAKIRGNWSIWYTVFQKHQEFLNLLLDSIPGTRKDYFTEE